MAFSSFLLLLLPQAGQQQTAVYREALQYRDSPPKVPLVVLIKDLGL